MNKGLIFKTVLLLSLLASVLATIVTIMKTGPGEAVPAGHNETFLHQFVISGGPVVWFVLLPMSLIMVYLTADNCLIIRRKNLLPADAADRVVRILKQQVSEAPEGVSEQNDLLTTAFVLAVTRSRDDWFRAKGIISESLQDQAMKLMRRIEWLSLIGNVSPMVGLFGTVFGMIQLFNAIVTAGGQPQPAHLAGGISVALVTTFWGLVIAIPALAMYSVLRSRIEALVNDAIVEAENILPQVRLLMKKEKPITEEPEKIAIVEIPPRQKEVSLNTPKSEASK